MGSFRPRQRRREYASQAWRHPLLYADGIQMPGKGGYYVLCVRGCQLLIAYAIRAVNDRAAILISCLKEEANQIREPREPATPVCRQLCVTHCDEVCGV